MPQRRVSLPAPARTTRMNGGPRLRMAIPLPPFRASAVRSIGCMRVRAHRMDREIPAARPAPAGERTPVAPTESAVVEEGAAFPMDAFIIPEGAARLPTGVGEGAVRSPAPEERAGPEAGEPDATVAVAAAGAVAELVDRAPVPARMESVGRTRSATLREQRALDVANRLEALAAQLRNHGYEVLAQRSVRGDALDALLAGVIAGYLVAAE